jgi:hypothetical protein
MNAWTQAGLKAALDGLEKMLVTAQTLNMALGAGNVAILPMMF